MSFKLRAQLLIALIVMIVSTTLTYYHIFQEHEFALQRAERSSANVKLTFDAMLKDTEHFYSFRAFSNIHSEGVSDAIKKRDTQALYNLSYPRYKTLREENPSLIIMQFHASNGLSILRMHRKELFGDDIASRRPMLREVHKSHKLLSGFEGGIRGIAYRIVVPVFEGANYIGALEFGIDTNYFIEKIKKYTASESVLLIHQDLLGAADERFYKNGIGMYRYSAIRDDQKELMALFAKNNSKMQSRVITLNKKDYEINPLFLKDSLKRNIGVILTINDVSKGYRGLIEIVMGSVLLTLIMIIVFWGVFEYIFNRLFEKLNLQEQYIHTILDSEHNIVIVTDGETIIYANQAFFDFFGYSDLTSFRLEHQCICDFFEEGESDEYLKAKMDDMLWTEYLMFYPNIEHKVKMSREGKASIFTVHSQQMDYKNQIRHVVVFTDITKLNELATLDVLTQISNRFQFDKNLDHFITLSERYAHEMSMLLIDIDHFKNVNDSYGHLVGDEVLKKLVHVLLGGIRKSDIIARWGGEEFVILLPQNGLYTATKLAESLCKAVEAHDFAPVNHITCSIGVAEWKRGENADELLHRVDEKLYRAKEMGRNCVVS
ncbi:MAG: diguanylate cyclase [Sulfuricurvum sp.]|nr:diguanylate cyclase [Sulfuricurvum sp.]